MVKDAPPGVPAPVRRARRRSDEVRGLILSAARATFAERGYAGATTRLIARRAAVAEPLIFGNFGTKAALFDEAVIAPFNSRLTEYLAALPAMPPDREQRNARFVHTLYPFLRENGDLLHALVRSGADMEPATRHALDGYFDHAAAQMAGQYARLGLAIDVAPHLLVRYAFGMLAGAVLFGDWFFPDTPPSDAVAEQALARMIHKAAEPSRGAAHHDCDEAAAAGGGGSTFTDGPV